VYLIALVASHIVERVIPPEWYRLPGPAYQFVDVTAAEGEHVKLAYLEWKPALQRDRPPVILLHGCPGQATDFVRLGPRLAEAGYRAIAIDQIGFGESTHWARDYSIAANARAVLGLMSELEIARAHVLGWSNGGGTALWMADDAPDRVASVTMMAAIGLQEEEGSGSYFFEHVKYGAGWVALVGGGELVPHFGLLGPTWFRHASMRFFWDSDQRPLRGAMERMRVPTLVLHGRDDFLVPARAAEEHHRIIGTSRLVMMHASHFIPFLQAEEATEHFTRFSARHDEPGVTALRQVADLAPEGRHLFGAAGVWGEEAIRRVPWLVLVLAVASLIVWRQRLGAVLAAIAVNFGLVDLGVVVAGIVVGLAVVSAASWGRGKQRRGGLTVGHGIHARSERLWKRVLGSGPIAWGFGSRLVPGEQEAALEAAGRIGSRPALWVAAIVSWIVWSLLYTIPVLVGAMFIAHPLAERFGAIGLAAGVCAAWLQARVTELLLTRTGRRVLRMRWARATHREYWPTAVLYAPLLPRVLWLGTRHGLTTFTCCNPGISGGGGMIGESKREILGAMNGSRHVLPAEFIAAGPGAEERSRRALEALRDRRELGGLPVILKPDEGQRGFGVKLARGESDVESYFREVTTPVLVQRFHPGPHECGVLWMRRHGEEGQRDETGIIYSITRKEFPFVTGDGRRTLEELIWRHPRFRNQAGVFLERFADERDRIPVAGESVRLAQSGNHCQGTLFRDGADLITPELTREIDLLARGFKGGLDMARLDVRYESEEAFKRGENFGIVELNGTAGESTNIYDPERSIAWCYRVLGGQFEAAYELGAVRKRAGTRGMSVRELIGAVRKHARERRGSEVAD
jgi:pimeloyl-ACP methyl ester carboxylesterase